jgi:hypothetical protein
MPIKHNSTAYISTAKLNQVLNRLGARHRGGPQDPTLTALTLQKLVARWKRSTTHADKRLMRLVERIAEIEIELRKDGGDTQEELQKPGHGRFSAALMELTTHSLRAPHVPAHDPGVLREQFSMLWNYERHHGPLPPASQAHGLEYQRRETAQRIGAWVHKWWENYRPLREEFSCLCQYRHEAPTYQDLYGKGKGYRTPGDLFHRLLGHLHRESHNTIKDILVNYQQLERRM